jgi:OmcA/MtrC family decaheme c-type cytochrome
MVGVVACTGCHESTKFYPNSAAGTAHQSLSVTVDSLCTTCHSPASIDANHAIPGITPNAAYQVASQFSYTITSVKSTAVGQLPVVTFRVNNATDSNIKTSKYWTQTATGASRLAVVLGWNTGKYTNAGAGITPVTGTQNTDGQPISLDALKNAVATANPGEFTVTSTLAVPTGTAGPMIVAIEGHPAVPADSAVDPGLRIPVTNAVAYYNLNSNPTVQNPATKPFADTLASAFVNLASCNECHGNTQTGTQLSLHGNNRQGNLDYCTACHNTEATDAARRPAAGGIDGKTQVPIDFKTMIHEIHTANIVVYGFGNSVNSFTDVTYPMPLANCQACHVNSATAYFGPTATANGTTTKIGNTAADNLRTTKWFATCGSCHTDGTSIAHMKGFGGSQDQTQAQIDALNGPQPVPAAPRAQ